jgi:hypothetical protein
MGVIYGTIAFTLGDPRIVLLLQMMENLYPKVYHQPLQLCILQIFYDLDLYLIKISKYL